MSGHRVFVNIVKPPWRDLLRREQPAEIVYTLQFEVRDIPWKGEIDHPELGGLVVSIHAEPIQED